MNTYRIPTFDSAGLRSVVEKFPSLGVYTNFSNFQTEVDLSIVRILRDKKRCLLDRIAKRICEIPFFKFSDPTRTNDTFRYERGSESEIPFARYTYIRIFEMVGPNANGKFFVDLRIVSK